MSWFKRKPKVSAQALIKERIDTGFGDTRDTIASLMEKVGVQPDEQEMLIFSALSPLISMTLAGLDESIRLRYITAAIQKMEDINPGAGQHLENRFHQYIEAFTLDIAAGKGHLAPEMYTLALENMLGKADEGVVLARMSLVLVYMKTIISVDVPFLKEFRVVP